uniref:Uncharacterized protein At3g61260 n=1 Tax=Anthurium amnicola TaxID=1678845 RepID=A0A1D1YCP0_9ARAE
MILHLFGIHLHTIFTYSLMYFSACHPHHCHPCAQMGTLSSCVETPNTWRRRPLSHLFEPKISSNEKIESTKDAATMISPFILRKDAATQRSREGTTSSSPKERPHFSLSSSPTTEELQRHFSKLEVRDVQVDDLVTMSRWSKLHASHGADVDSANIVEWKKKTVEPSPSAWGVADTTKCISKFWREEAKITAWENLQKAKAEAALRKLEMKLERKRSSSMDKILNKLKLAQRKADNMRNAVTACQVDQVTRTGKKAPSFRLTRQMGSLSGCFTCHVF